MVVVIKLLSTSKTKQLCKNSSQDDDNQSFDASDSKLSYIDTKTTSKEKQQSSAAVSFREEKKESDFTKSKSDKAKSSSFSAQENKNTFKNKQNIGKNKNLVHVEYIVNKKWKEQIKALDNAGIPVNKTLIKIT